MTWRGRNIYLVGLPGAGKSSIGRELAKLLAKAAYEFVDLDTMIEQRASKRIAELFREPGGEEKFREAETDALLELSDRSFGAAPVIVAAGGGVVLRSLNRAVMRGTGIVVWIDVNVRQASKRVLKSTLEGNARPLLQASSPEELTMKLRTLLTQREEFYSQATLHFVSKNAREEDRSAAELAEELYNALEQMSRHIRLKPRFHTVVAKSAFGSYPVHIGNGIAATEIAAAIRDSATTHVAIITDKNVARLNASRFTSKLAQELSGRVVLNQIALDPGEKNKNFETLSEILNSLFKLAMPRKGGMILTIGGGVVGDLGGLAASLYKRGLPLVHVPTTLLAQVDSALGGKTGIDYFGSKNSVGTFYPPKLVIIDPIYLKTLDKRELHAGLGEVFKYALIGSKPMWQSLAKSVRRLLRGVDASYESIIRSSVEEKLRYIERDEFERASGVRELLNLGHTFGHALEAATQFTTFLHGEAVLLGLRAAAWLSLELKLLSEQEWREIEIVLGRIPIAASTTVSAAEILAAMSWDKKRSTKGTRFVLLRSIGEAMIVDKVPEASVTEAIEFMLSLV